MGSTNGEKYRGVTVAVTVPASTVENRTDTGVGWVLPAEEPKSAYRSWLPRWTVPSSVTRYPSMPRRASR